MPTTRPKKTPARPKPDEELTYEHTMELLGVSKHTVYALVKSGALTKYVHPFGRGRGGRRMFFRRSEVERLARSTQPVKPPADARRKK